MTTAEKAARLWPVLVKAAQERRTLTYTDCTKVIGGIAQGVGHVLGPIQRYCQYKGLPYLTAVVVHKGTIEQGSGFEGGDSESALEETYAYDWSKVVTPRPGTFASYL